ncbi:hypothetical protein ACJMK2_041912 [Sinanodonta woodiana]|uniref:Uncharacterized protein n=1 Tax=Sinanodonta woodiana TaxID=1069815 RepID=A0ABD3W5P9_SINWO
MRLIELNSLTLLNAVAIGVFSFAMLFNVIAYTTDYWCTFNYEGIQWNVGLWRGCWRNETLQTQICTTEIFKEKWFNSGTHWSQGTSAMMSISLACLFLLELVIICYACVKDVQRFREKIVGAVLALSWSAGGFSTVGLIITGTELTKLSDPLNVHLSWSLGFEIFSLLLTILTGSLVCADMWKYKSSIKHSTETKVSRSPEGIHTADTLTGVVATIKDDDNEEYGMLKVKHAPCKTEQSSFISLTVTSHATTSLPELNIHSRASAWQEDSSFHTQSSEIIALSYERYGPCFVEGTIECLV